MPNPLQTTKFGEDHSWNKIQHYQKKEEIVVRVRLNLFLKGYFGLLASCFFCSCYSFQITNESIESAFEM
jgi:hypothetical protein